MPVEKGKLKQADETRIRKNYPLLLNELDAKFLVSDLFSNNVFTLDDKEEINNQASRGKRTEVMLDKLLHSGPGKAYDVFMKALQKDYPHIAEEVEKTAVENTNPVDAYAWYSEVPDETLEHMITDADASRYSGCFGENWQTVIIRLGVSNATIEQERQKSPGNVGSVITNLLIKWRQRVFKKATVKALLEVTKEVDQQGMCTINWDLIREITLEKIEA